MATTLRSLFDRLSMDPLRQGTPFSGDMVTAARVLWHPFAVDHERQEAMNRWLQGNQPCLFGRIAAKQRAIEYCFVTEREFLESDELVENKIREARQLWKRRALRGRPLHGFMLCVLSERLALSAPDGALREFSLRMQDLAGWPSVADVNGNSIATESLYLLNPIDKSYIRFEFSVDYFASAGDVRWWHDHRIPGGIAFTANSLGHMVRVNQWYRGQSGNQVEWALRTAMLTIASAADTSQGKATWLLDLTAAGRFKPFEWKENVPLPDLQKLDGKDCGSYAGYLHTDHAVRTEFFDPRPLPPRMTEPYAMDFAYIFDPASPDYQPFMVGSPIDESDVVAELGNPSEWRTIGTSDEQSDQRPAFVQDEIQRLLEACRVWELPDTHGLD